VVFHRVGELGCKKATGEERLEWDRKSCANMFEALELNLEKKAINQVLQKNWREE
jgi:hypothetical protein